MLVDGPDPSQLFEAFLPLVNGIFLMWDADGSLLWSSEPSSLSLEVGSQPSRSLAPWLAGITAAERHDVAEFYRTVSDSIPGTVHQRRYRLLGPAGSPPIPVSESTTVKVHDGQRRRLALIVPVTQLEGAEKHLAAEKDRLEMVLSSTNLGMWDWNIRTGELVLDRRWAQMIGYSPSELDSLDLASWLSMVHPQDRTLAESTFAAAALGGVLQHDIELRMTHRNGHTVWVRNRGRVVLHDSDGRPWRMTGIHEDISDRKVAEGELRAESLLDPLTGLGNRRMFELTVSGLIDLRLGGGDDFALLLLDVDRLKLVNDTEGHVAGDAVLRQVAETLEQTVRVGDVAVRLAGDEFAVLLPKSSNRDSARVASRIKAGLARGGSSGRRVSVSIGVGTIGEVDPIERGSATDELVDLVDGRLYQDKSRGRAQGRR